MIHDEAKNPVILPKQHHVVDLIVSYYHARSGHSGLEHVLSMIRERFWVVKARVAVGKVIGQCFDCKRRQGPAGVQKMADLPEDTLTPETSLHIHGSRLLWSIQGAKRKKRRKTLWCSVQVLSHMRDPLRNNS